MDINFYVKSMGSFIILSAYVIWDAYPNVTFCTLTCQNSGNGEDMPSNMLSFINFEPLELYWTYFLALQTMTPKIPPTRLMSLDHEPKNEMMCHELEPWALMPFCVNRALLGFRRDFPKIHDNVDVVRVANEMKPCCVKNLPSTGFN